LTRLSAISADFEGFFLSLSIINSIYLLLDLDGVRLVNWHLNLIWNLLLDGVWDLDLLVDWVRSG
jgi:hypothetical protein